MAAPTLLGGGPSCGRLLLRLHRISSKQRFSSNLRMRPYGRAHAPRRGTLLRALLAAATPHLVETEVLLELEDAALWPRPRSSEGDPPAGATCCGYTASRRNRGSPRT